MCLYYEKTAVLTTIAGTPFKIQFFIIYLSIFILYSFSVLFLNHCLCVHYVFLYLCLSLCPFLCLSLYLYLCMSFIFQVVSLSLLCSSVCNNSFVDYFSPISFTLSSVSFHNILFFVSFSVSVLFILSCLFCLRSHLCFCLYFFVDLSNSKDYLSLSIY